MAPTASSVLSDAGSGQLRGHGLHDPETCRPRRLTVRFVAFVFFEVLYSNEGGERIKTTAHGSRAGVPREPCSASCQDKQLVCIRTHGLYPRYYQGLPVKGLLHPVAGATNAILTIFNRNNICCETCSSRRSHSFYHTSGSFVMMRGSLDCALGPTRSASVDTGVMYECYVA